MLCKFFYHRLRQSENFELEILEGSLRSSYGWLVSNTVDDGLGGKKEKKRQKNCSKIFKYKIEARPVYSVKADTVDRMVSNIEFHLRQIWLQTLVAIDCESRLTLFPSFCAPPSEFTVLFDSNLSRCPFLGQVVDLDLLLCTVFDSEHAVLFLCHIFIQRPMSD